MFERPTCAAAYSHAELLYLYLFYLLLFLYLNLFDIDECKTILKAKFGLCVRAQAKSHVWENIA